MKSCADCGRENCDEADCCSECGTSEFVVSTTVNELRKPESERPSEQAKSFFRWRPASVALLALAVVYGFFALLNLWLGRVQVQRGDEHAASLMYWGSFWNAIVAALCMAGRKLMKSQDRSRLMAGVFAVATALFIVMRTWVSALLGGRNPFPIIEALLIWLPMFYAIIYGYRESKTTHAADIHKDSSEND